MKSNSRQAIGTAIGAATLAVLVAIAILAGAVPATAQTFTTLVNFDNTNGNQPVNQVMVQGFDGNLYGTTYLGGTLGHGNVFKITPAGVISTVYEFCLSSGCPDGSAPAAALTVGTDGNLYGTTRYGGAGACGVVFKLTRAGVLTTLHSFNNTDGCYPTNGLMQASNGNFYGTTTFSGASGYGTLFEITSSGAFKVLHNFDGTNAGGGTPGGELVQLTNGNLYGGTVAPQASVVYELTMSGGSFRTFPFANINANVYGPLIQGSNGDVFGTTSFAPSNGTVFKMTPAGTITTVYNFCSLASCADGSQPLKGVIQASDGNFYGTTYNGGTSNDGILFKLTSAGKLTTLHNFDGTTGNLVDSGVVQHTNGTIYGLTHGGGTMNIGTVYSYSNKLPAFVHSVTPGGIVGSRVIILGSNLKTATAVSFNGTPATFTAVSATEITTTVPAGATTGKLKVTLPTTTLNSERTFYVTPQITSFTPPNGIVGTSVTITGVALTTTSKVTFGGKSATFTVVSDTEVTATVPTGAKTGRIVITTTGGVVTSSATFTVN